VLSAKKAQLEGQAQAGAVGVSRTRAPCTSAEAVSGHTDAQSRAAWTKHCAQQRFPGWMCSQAKVETA
jgi:hypothetical protein